MIDPDTDMVGEVANLFPSSDPIHIPILDSSVSFTRPSTCRFPEGHQDMGLLCFFFAWHSFPQPVTKNGLGTTPSPRFGRVTDPKPKANLRSSSKETVMTTIEEVGGVLLLEESGVVHDGVANAAPKGTSSTSGWNIKNGTEQRNLLARQFLYDPPRRRAQILVGCTAER